MSGDECGEQFNHSDTKWNELSEVVMMEVLNQEGEELVSISYYYCDVTRS